MSHIWPVNSRLYLSAASRLLQWLESDRIQAMDQAPEREGETGPDAADPPASLALGERLALNAGYGPTFNGYAVPLIDQTFEEVWTDDWSKFMKLDCWIFKALCGNRGLKSFGMQGLKSLKTTCLGRTLLAKFNSCLGRHTRTLWFVDLERQTLATVSVDTEGVPFEFLPSSKVLAIKYSTDALNKFAELARATIEGNLSSLQPERSEDLKNHALIRQAAKASLSEEDLQALKDRGIKWQPPKLRFVIGDCNREVKAGLNTRCS